MWTEQRSDASEPFLISSPWCPSDRVQDRLPYTLNLLDFEGSTIISEQFEQVKHHAVCLTWHVIEMTHWQNKWSQKKNPGTILSYLKFFFWIEVHVVLKEFYVFYGTRGNYLHAQPFKSRCDFKFYCLKTGIRFYSHMTSHWQMLFSDIFNG